MTHFPVLSVHFNSDDYPYDYHLAIWKNEGVGTCLYYIREDDIPSHFDQFLTVGQTLRWIHTGKVDTEYRWNDIDFFSGSDLQKKCVLGMRWEELLDSGMASPLPLMMTIRFPGRRNTSADEIGFVSRKIGCSV
jgi:hypothetical protein